MKLDEKVEFVTFYFNEYYSFMSADIDKGIKSGANYLVALALATYTEVWGGLLNGNLGLKDKSRENFNYMFRKMKCNDKSYINDTDIFLSESGKKVSAYDYFRCGLVHQYFIKGRGVIFNDINDYANKRDPKVKGLRIQGLKYDNKIKAIRLFTNTYWRDLKEQIELHRDEMLVEKKEWRLNNFIKSIKRIKDFKYN